MKANQNIAKFLTVIDNMDKQSMVTNDDRIPGLIMSHPGFGKTSTIRKWCFFKDYNLFTIIPSMQAADDILGIQSVKDGRMVRLTPSWYNKLTNVMSNGKRTVLFIDEISTCDPYIQGPLLDLIFSRNLGEERLPDDVLIVAAGNYAEDLNNAFSLSSPMVNRFMLLNLWNKDFNLVELLTDEFTDLSTKADTEKYFGLKKGGRTYDFSKFKEWVKTSREITFGKSETSDDPDFGLFGFTSVRSFTFSMKFAEAYMSTFDDNLWMRVIGDTLGKSDKREGKPYRLILEANADIFMKRNSAVDCTTIAAVCTEISKNMKNNSSRILDTDLAKKLVEVVKSTPANAISSADLKKFAEVATYYSNDPKVIALSSVLSDKVTNII